VESRNCCAWTGSALCMRSRQMPGDAGVAGRPQAVAGQAARCRTQHPRHASRGYGLKVGEVSHGCFEARIRELIEGHDMLATVIGPMLKARAALWEEFTRLHPAMLKIARVEPVCHRLMSLPGVGALVALTYRSAVDDPGRFSRFQAVGAYFRLLPGKYRSGETDRDGGITRVGDGMVRNALYEAAHIMLTRASRFASSPRSAASSVRICCGSRQITSTPATPPIC